MLVTAMEALTNINVGGPSNFTMCLEVKKNKIKKKNVLLVPILLEKTEVPHGGDIPRHHSLTEILALVCNSI